MVRCDLGQDRQACPREGGGGGGARHPDRARRHPGFRRGRLYVFDKGYTDYHWWSEIRAAGAVFVTRRKRNAHCRLVAEQTATGEGILADRLIKIGHRQARGGAPRNPLYEVSLREITVARPDHDQPLYLLTNDRQRPAIEIAQLYKERWDPGLRRGGPLLFKWLKQNLKIRRFLGRSQNAVRTQIYVALIAFMLLRILHHTAARAFKDPTALLLTHIKFALFSPFSLSQSKTPPPKPPALRPPSPQTCLAW